MKYVKSIATITIMLMIATCVSAQNLSYNNISTGYINGDASGLDYDGFGVEFIGEMNQNFFLLLGYTSLEFDNLSADGKAIGIGAGWHTPLNETIDFVATLAYSKNETNHIDGTGYSCAAGIRSMISDYIELSAFLKYASIDFDDIGDTDGSGASISARYFIIETISTGVTVATFDSSDSTTIDLRFDF